MTISSRTVSCRERTGSRGMARRERRLVVGGRVRRLSMAPGGMLVRVGNERLALAQEQKALERLELAQERTARADCSF
jgi:hypothetical protein